MGFSFVTQKRILFFQYLEMRFSGTRKHNVSFSKGSQRHIWLQLILSPNISGVGMCPLWLGMSHSEVEFDELVAHGRGRQHP